MRFFIQSVKLCNALFELALLLPKYGLQHSKFIFYPIKMSLMVLCNALEKMTVTGKLMVELMVLATVSASTTVSLNGSPKAKEKVR